jgi:hypothetical protein
MNASLAALIPPSSLILRSLFRSPKMLDSVPFASDGSHVETLLKYPFLQGREHPPLRFNMTSNGQVEQLDQYGRPRDLTQLLNLRFFQTRLALLFCSETDKITWNLDNHTVSETEPQFMSIHKDLREMYLILHNQKEHVAHMTTRAARISFGDFGALKSWMEYGRPRHLAFFFNTSTT